jgi:hypothetical protein
LSSGRVSSAWDRTGKLSPAEHRRQLLGVGKATDLLRVFVTDVGRCWKEATGHPLPKLTAEVVERYYLGYGPAFAGIAASHPLWLILYAVKVKVGGMAVDEIVCWLREEAGE